MIKQGAVKIDGEKVADPRLEIAVNTENVYQIGKRKFAKVKIMLDGPNNACIIRGSFGGSAFGGVESARKLVFGLTCRMGRL